MKVLGRNPARIIPAWRDFVDEQVAAGSGMRGIGEPIWSGRSSAEIDECQRHEALLNLAFAGSPAWSLLCPYDSGALDPDILEAACHSHPHLTRRGSRGSNPSCDQQGPTASPFEGHLPAPPADLASMSFGRAQLGEVRGLVAQQAIEAGLRADRMADLITAASELASNSILHGGGRGTMRVWRAADALFVEVVDRGFIESPLVGRIRPTLTQEHGRGLWLVNHLCDLAQIRSEREETAVRVQIALA